MHMLKTINSNSIGKRKFLNVLHDIKNIKRKKDYINNVVRHKNIKAVPTVFKYVFYDTRIPRYRVLLNF